MIKKLILVLTTYMAIVIPMSVSADPPQPPPPLAWDGCNITRTYPHCVSRQLYHQVEQDGFALNPFFFAPNYCVWDVDDFVHRWTNQGALGVGATASYSECVMADAFHLIGFWITSGSRDIEITVTFTNYVETRTFKINYAGLDTGGRHTWRGCITTPGFLTGPPTYQQVQPGTTADAVPTTMTVTVRNLGAAIIPDRKHFGVDPVTKIQPDGFVQFIQAFCPSGNYVTRLGIDPKYKFDGFTEVLP